MSFYPNQYGTQQTSAQNVPQQHQRRQSASQARYPTSTTSPQVPSRSEYPEQSSTTSPISPNNRTDVLIPKSPYTRRITTEPLNPSRLSRRTSTLTPAMRRGTLLSQSRIRLPPAVLSNAAPLGTQQPNTPSPAIPSNARPPDSQQVITLLPAVPYHAATPHSPQRFTLLQAVLFNTASRRPITLLPAMLSNTTTIPDSRRPITLLRKHSTLPMPRIPCHSRRRRHPAILVPTATAQTPLMALARLITCIKLPLPP
ncbi:hypothetical protein EDB87DRAFT_159419 [Lactarius vividus]|nr:hypothetical protein EDB87DRAFT_159419 [Lactarius vividus]